MSESVVALVGPPNVGKTTLFNNLTGSRSKVVNYPGSTVDYTIGRLVTKSPINLIVIDTPGIQSLPPRTEDEKVTLHALQSITKIVPEGREYPDVIAVIIDASQPQRHLILTKQLLDAGLSVVVGVSLNDIAEKNGVGINVDTLSDLLECPVVQINPRTGEGVGALTSEILKESALGEIPRKIDIPNMVSTQSIKELFEWAEECTNEASTIHSAAELRPKGIELDSVLLHPFSGPLIFFLIMGAFFWSIFTFASPMIDAVDAGFAMFISLASSLLPDHWISSFITEGAIAGIGAVLVFVPQIAILFFAIGLMEESGYLARGAILIDKPLSKIGLNGRSFVPLLSGCACAIPAMMAARSIPGKKERLLTIFVIPLMTCSARLPVYGLLLALLFPNSPLKAGLGLLSIYVASIVLASVAVAVVSRLILKKEAPSSFHIELPSWRSPNIKNIVTNSIRQTWAFIKRAGPTIIVVSAVLWLLSSYPSPDNSYAAMMGKLLEPVLKPMGVDWRVGVAILLAFAAREVFVSALIVIFGIGSESMDSILPVVTQATFSNGDPIFTPASIIGLIVFFMIALQCGATVAIARKELASHTYAWAMTGVYTLVAYVAAVITVNGLRFLGVD
jgi:ferrous iron transport protein B